jgi:glycerol-3-phosphate cytidylyltransferase
MHIRFLSEEYLNRDFTGKQYCLDNDIEIHYHKRQHTYSSSELRKRVYELEKKKNEEQPRVEQPQHSPELIKL